MRKRRTNILLPTTILVMVGLLGRAWIAEDSKTAPRAGLASAPLAASAASVQHTPLTAAMPPVAPANLPEPAIIAPAMHPEELSAEGNALVGEMCDLQLLAQGTGLTLDSRQWSALAAVVLRAQATRLTFEARIATAKMIAPGKYRLEIPAYANAGNVLREQFTHELCAELGEPVAVDVLAKLGPKLEGRFAGYGVSEQTLEITNADGPPDDVQVTRTATYWNVSLKF